MKRRELLSKMVLASVAAGAAPLSYPMRALAASCAPIPSMPRTLVNVMLNGGADLRFLFMPRPGVLEEEHENLIFSARKKMYASSRSNSGMTYAEMFALEYVVPEGPNLPLDQDFFGIHRSAGWLTSQFAEGNVQRPSVREIGVMTNPS